jgi:outer membrane protein assembly factor BamB
MRNFVLGAALFSLLSASIYADWPQFLGPDRNGAATDLTIAEKFPGGEPEILWKHAVGAGFAGPAVANGAVIVFHRKGDQAVAESLDAADGTPRWKFEYPTDYVDDFGFDNGPRATPLVAGDRIFLFGAEGMVHCLDAKTGKANWAKDLRKELGADKGFFGRASSPLLADNILVMQIGGEGAGIIGLDAKSGAIKWKATDHEAGYASPVAATIKGRKYSLHFTREGFVCLDPANGKVLIERKHRAKMHASVNAATPIFIAPDKVFITACYDVGATLWQLDPAAGTIVEIWAAGKKLDCHYATPVRHRGRLIGFHGRQETGTTLRCIEAATGEIKWTSEKIPAGSVTLAGDSLIVLTERGELILAKAGGESFSPTARGQILANGTRSFPALSGGRLFSRDKRQLVCVNLEP